MRSFLAVLGVIVAGSSIAGPFEDGAAAYADGDYVVAIGHWLPLAESGDLTAQFNVGVMYDHGQGVARDAGEAEKWYRLAAEQGDAVAQTNLGVIFGQGRGVAQDHAEAAKWYGRAAEKEHGPAQFSLAILYANGRGVPQNLSKATELYERAEMNSCTMGASTTSDRARLVASGS